MALPFGLLALALLAFIMTGPSHAETGKTQVYGPFLPVKALITATKSDKVTIQKLISDQLDAIRERDADLAYALTTGALHRKYETAGQFLSEMRFSYRPVYNHESYRFLDQTETETGSLIQRVEVSYTHGDPTVVIYRLQRTPEGDWGIDSFTVLDFEEGQPI